MIQAMTKNEITFLGEQDGDVERDFKNELNKLFLKNGEDIRAYLAKMQYGSVSEFNVALCLKLRDNNGDDILKKCAKVFSLIFSSNEHLDILILTDEQELKLRKLCCPFYTGSNFQISCPDFYLTSSEGYNLDNIIISCFKRKRLYGRHPDGYILCDIKPAILGQYYNLGDKDIEQIVIASRHKGYSLFPILEWPFYVHVARSLGNLVFLSYIEDSDIEFIAWAELYKNKDDIHSVK